MVTKSERKERVFRYIEDNLGCTRTKLYDSMAPYMAEGTAKNLLRELIEEDKEVNFLIDHENPRKHHLIINNKKTEDQLLKKQRYQIVQLTSGEKWLFPLFGGGSLPITKASINQTYKNLMAMAELLQY